MPPWVERHDYLRKLWMERKKESYIETPYEEVS